MKYKVTVEQTVKHTASDGHEWESSECIEGVVPDYEMLTAFIGNISVVFPDATIIITSKEDE